MLSAEQLPAIRDQLLSAACEARRCAYAPYSGYTVGAAVWCDGGGVFTGANVENASYGLTVCAERVALLHAVSSGVRKVYALLVVTRDGGAPCGACRQVLAEFADAAAVVWCAQDGKDEIAEYRLSELLPRAFRLPERRSELDELTLGGA